MEIYLADQLKACLAFFILGAVTGLCYDIIRTIRDFFVIGNHKGRNIFGFLCDLLLDLAFMVVLAVAVVLLTYCYSYGKLRFFDVLSFLLSLFFYSLSLRRLYRATVTPIFKKIRRIIRYVSGIAVRPLFFIFNTVKSFVIWVFRSSLGKFIVKLRSVKIESDFVKLLERLETDVIF